LIFLNEKISPYIFQDLESYESSIQVQDASNERSPDSFLIKLSGNIALRATLLMQWTKQISPDILNGN